MPESTELTDLRAALANPAPATTGQEKKDLAEDALGRILDAAERGVVELGGWEVRCLTKAIQLLDSGSYEMSRSVARKALWPDENRREAAIAKYRSRMNGLAEMRARFASAQKVAVR